MDLKMKGKVAFVTGGSHGLAKAICLSLAAEGILTTNEEKYLNRIPLRRIGTTEEVSDVVTFLASVCACQLYDWCYGRCNG